MITGKAYLGNKSVLGYYFNNLLTELPGIGGSGSGGSSPSPRPLNIFGSSSGSGSGSGNGMGAGGAGVAINLLDLILAEIEKIIWDRANNTDYKFGNIVLKDRPGSLKNVAKNPLRGVDIKDFFYNPSSNSIYVIFQDYLLSPNFDTLVLQIFLNVPENVEVENFSEYFIFNYTRTVKQIVPIGITIDHVPYFFAFLSETGLSYHSNYETSNSVLNIPRSPTKILRKPEVSSRYYEVYTDSAVKEISPSTDYYKPLSSAGEREVTNKLHKDLFFNDNGIEIWVDSDNLNELKYYLDYTGLSHPIDGVFHVNDIKHIIAIKTGSIPEQITFYVLLKNGKLFYGATGLTQDTIIPWSLIDENLLTISQTVNDLGAFTNILYGIDLRNNYLVRFNSPGTTGERLITGGKFRFIDGRFGIRWFDENFSGNLHGFTYTNGKIQGWQHGKYYIDSQPTTLNYNGTGWWNGSFYQNGTLSMLTFVSVQRATIEYHLVSVNSNYSGVLDIPSTFDNTIDGSGPVTAINPNAFAGCSKITNIAIPASVQAIPNNAFLECTGLTNITISTIFHDREDRLGLSQELFDKGLWNGWMRDYGYLVGPTRIDPIGAASKSVDYPVSPNTIYIHEGCGDCCRIEIDNNNQGLFIGCNVHANLGLLRNKIDYSNNGIPKKNWLSLSTGAYVDDPFSFDEDQNNWIVIWGNYNGIYNGRIYKNGVRFTGLENGAYYVKGLLTYLPLTGTGWWIDAYYMAGVRTTLDEAGWGFWNGYFWSGGTHYTGSVQNSDTEGNYYYGGRYAFNWYLIADNTAVLISNISYPWNYHVLNFPGKLVVPEKINNLPVKIVGHHTFQRAQFLTELVLPTTIEEIYSSAFSWNTYDTVSLTSLTLPIKFKDNLPQGLQPITTITFNGTMWWDGIYYVNGVATTLPETGTGFWNDKYYSGGQLYTGWLNGDYYENGVISLPPIYNGSSGSGSGSGSVGEGIGLSLLDVALEETEEIVWKTNGDFLNDTYLYANVLFKNRMGELNEVFPNSLRGVDIKNIYYSSLNAPEFSKNIFVTFQNNISTPNEISPILRLSSSVGDFSDPETIEYKINNGHSMQDIKYLVDAFDAQLDPALMCVCLNNTQYKRVFKEYNYVTDIDRGEGILPSKILNDLSDNSRYFEVYENFNPSYLNHSLVVRPYFSDSGPMETLRTERFYIGDVYKKLFFYNNEFITYVRTWDVSVVTVIWPGGQYNFSFPLGVNPDNIKDIIVQSPGGPYSNRMVYALMNNGDVMLNHDGYLSTLRENILSIVAAPNGLYGTDITTNELIKLSDGTSSFYPETRSGDKFRFTTRYFGAKWFDESFTGAQNNFYYEDGKINGWQNGKYYIDSIPTPLPESGTGLWNSVFYFNGEQTTLNTSGDGWWNERYFVAGIPYTGWVYGIYHVNGYSTLLPQSGTGWWNAAYYISGQITTLNETGDGVWNSKYYSGGNLLHGWINGIYYIRGVGSTLDETGTGFWQETYYVSGELLTGIIPGDTNNIYYAFGKPSFRYTLNSFSNQYFIENRPSIFSSTIDLIIPSAISGFPFSGQTSWTTTTDINFESVAENLINIIIPFHVKTHIGYGSFGGAPKLKTADLSGVHSIGFSAFSGCQKLETVIFTNDLVSIGSSAFSNCHALKNINIPATVNTIGNNAFLNAGLTSVTLPQSFSTELARIGIGSNVAVTYI